MKQILKTSLLVTTSLIALAVSSPAALLFEEKWSNLNVGQNVSSGGRWGMTQGLPEQFLKADPALAGAWIAPVYTTGEGASVLPQMKTTEVFDLPTGGIDFAINVVFTNTSTQYFRIGLVAADSDVHNYWFTVHRGEVALHKRNGSATPIRLGGYTFASGEWKVNEPKDFSLRIIPGEGGNQLSLLFNGVSVITLTDSAGLPSFESGFHLFVAARENQLGHIGEMTLQSIPEGQSVVLMTGGGMLLLGAGLLRRRVVL